MDQISRHKVAIAADIAAVKLVCVLTILALCLGAGSALADELLWARKSTFGGLSTISIAQNGVLYCTGCNFNDYGRIAIQRGPGVGANVTGELHPWMSTLWVVLFRVDRGNHCEGDFFTISLNTHNLEHVNSSTVMQASFFRRTIPDQFQAR